jgi:hypothetical protein
LLYLLTEAAQLRITPTGNFHPVFGEFLSCVT